MDLVSEATLSRWKRDWYLPSWPIRIVIHIALALVGGGLWFGMGQDSGRVIIYVSVASFVVGCTVVGLTRLFRIETSDGSHESWWPAIIVGITEMFGYVVAIRMDQPEFIAVWLALKSAGQWGSWEHGYQGRARYQRFLIGSLLSVLSSIAIATQLA